MAKRDCALLASDDSTKDVRVAYTRWISVPRWRSAGRATPLPTPVPDSNARAQLQPPQPGSLPLTCSSGSAMRVPPAGAPQRLTVQPSHPDGLRTPGTGLLGPGAPAPSVAT